MRRMKRSGRKAEILVTVTAAVLLGAVLLLTGCAAREGGAIHPIALEAVQALTEIAAQLAVALIGVAGAALGTFYALSEDYRRARLMSFRDPFAYLTNEG